MSKNILFGIIITVMVMMFLVVSYGTGRADDVDGGPMPHANHPQDLPLHERFYSTWNMPNAGMRRTVSCCNKNDCYPTRIWAENGKYWALHRESGESIEVPANKLEQLQPDEEESPDGQSHICASRQKAVYCATMGSGQ